jgi:nickel-type superoxide dismutase maturation protease
MTSSAQGRAVGHGIAELMLWALCRRHRFRVTGRSMAPTLSDGDQLLIDPAGQPACGDLVIAEHPTDPSVLIVKRVAALVADDRVVLASDNPPEGTDSRRWGPLPASRIKGRVTLCLDRPLAGDLSTGRPPVGAIGGAR